MRYLTALLARSQKPRAQFNPHRTSRTMDTRKSIRRRRFAIEMLESRRLLTAGELDLTFGTDGRVLTDFGQGSTEFGYTSAKQLVFHLFVSWFENPQAGPAGCSVSDYTVS